ncbi:galactosyltransferase-related protein [Helicobacter rodentium]|uniref:capsular polysaccharide export protein, LipB/KpsS family n=8 Tax=Helicobacter rodentium TaxID=59617 RepID=UPI0023571829|nr:galactosyltransferase-related protein [Helicobacter rodentium]
MLSFIIPIFYKNSDSFIYKRALELIEKFKGKESFEVIFADCSKDSLLKSTDANIKIIHSPSKEQIFSPAYARNQAVSLATQKYLFFYDVDMDYSSNFESLLLQEIESKLESGKRRFLSLPFLYLTREGTMFFEQTRDSATLQRSFLKGENHLVESISANSSAIIIEKKYFESLGGFREDFLGHGGEDFEFLHRLAALSPHSQKPQDYYTDVRHQFLGDAKGFRKYLSFYSLPYFFKGLVLLHRWHSRALTNAFYFRRKPNEQLLLESMRRFDAQNVGWQSQKPMQNLRDFILSLMNQFGYPLEDYPGFFELGKGVKPIKKPLSGKIRKLLTRPKEFFGDSALLKKATHLRIPTFIYLWAFYDFLKPKRSYPKQLLENSPPIFPSRAKITKDSAFYGWGRKKTGFNAIALAQKYHCKFVLLEDGFIRSFDLGVKGASSFSLVQDEVGIYYDATRPSALENLLNTYDFQRNSALLDTAREAMRWIVQHNISKYNCTQDVPQGYFDSNKERVLIIAQTHKDSSLLYGYGEKFSTKEMIESAHLENPNAKIYLKIHPDVLSGKRQSDIEPHEIPPFCQVITEDFNPLSLLKFFAKVYTKTSQMGFEALLVGCECVCYGMPFYAGWGLTIDKQTCVRRNRKLSLEEVFAASYILYTQYYNPIYQRKSDIMDTLRTIARYKPLYLKTNHKAYFFGFSYWKHNFIKPFVPNYSPQDLIFINPISDSPLEMALKRGLDLKSDIFIWGRKSFPEVESYAKAKGLKVVRVEDGFIRSLSLGSDLTRPFSQVFDAQGMYFDPTQTSDLEEILQSAQFDTTLLQESYELKNKILKNKISKYNINSHKQLQIPTNKTKILVSGQVEDDASIAYGAPGETNLSLLKRVREENPNAYILYKPHPDVLSGNRIGQIEPQIALKYCDEIIDNVSLFSAIEAVDEVHILTSLSGFEALLYGKKVVTYGMPFYAGWGLTIDKQTCARRNRKLSLEELFCGAYLLYPRYIHPKTLEFCSPSVLVEELEKERQRMQKDKFYSFRIRLYSFVSRKAQRILKALK